MAKWVGLAITRVARGTSAIMRRRERSSASERRLALNSGSPSDCFISSLMSRRLIRMRFFQLSRVQTRSMAASTTKAVATPESSRMKMPSILSGIPVGWVNMASATVRCSDCSSKNTTKPTAKSLNVPLPNSMKPVRPNSRVAPALGEILDSFGWMRSSTKLGMFWAKETARPATMKITRIGTRKPAAACRITLNSSIASAPLCSAHRPGSSIRRASVSVMRAALSRSISEQTTSMASRPAKSGASREEG